MRLRFLVSVVLLAFLTALIPASSAEAASTIRFSRIYFDSPGSDYGSNASLNAEWFRIKNFGTRARTLTGWVVRDKTGYTYRFPTFTLRPGASVTVHTGRGTNTGSHLYWRQGGYVWNNTGDRAVLRNRGGTLIDSCDFTGAGSYKNC